jgi:hypothetical protein
MKRLRSQKLGKAQDTAAEPHRSDAEKGSSRSVSELDH